MAHPSPLRSVELRSNLKLRFRRRWRPHGDSNPGSLREREAS